MLVIGYSALLLSATPATTRSTYPIHHNITATEFWCGEPASSDNANISNEQSAWDDEWQKHFGGFDDPEHRDGDNPKGFVPKENPFYFALPYDDFADGKRKPDAAKIIPWAAQRQWKDNESMCKNRWIKIIANGKTCYAQWEDVGPFATDNAGYVFGPKPPKNKKNKSAGLDLSPAATKYLGLGGMDKVDWQFVEDADVADGPWKKIVTTSQISWR